MGLRLPPVVEIFQVPWCPACDMHVPEIAPELSLCLEKT